MPTGSQKKSGGTKKVGRNKTKCEAYHMLKKREKSHVRRILKHMEKYKDTTQGTKEALKRYRALI